MNDLSHLIGQEVVIDTRTPYIYLGTFEGSTDEIITLRDVDVHDMTDARGTKELYIMSARKLGIQHNRQRVHVLIREIISISQLADVMVFE